jgi:hypothetical protein
MSRKVAAVYIYTGWQDGTLPERAETQSWTEKKLPNSKMLHINGEIAYRKLICCTGITEMGDLRNLLHKINCKWYNKRKQDKGTRKRMENYCKAGWIKVTL